VSVLSIFHRATACAVIFRHALRLAEATLRVTPMGSCNIICLQWTATRPQKLPLPLKGSAPPCNTWFLGPIRVTTPNGISIGSAVFAGLTNVTNRPTDQQTQPAIDHATPCVATGCYRKTWCSLNSHLIIRTIEYYQYTK